jgi:acetoin utilization deacetylase AcuC-like enzyme
VRVAVIYHDDYARQDTDDEPEISDRAYAIASAVDEAELPGVQLVEPRPATVEQVGLVHAASHITRIRAIAESGGGYADQETAVRPASYELALLAAGGTIAAVNLVHRRAVDSAFAVVRPPGHHATPEKSQGFCLFNNLAIAARHARTALGVERILMIDFDVHHGNGSQAVFDDDPSVLYTSVHQHPLYPGTGLQYENGRGAGRGYNVNVPIPAGVGDEGYLRVFDEVFRPLAEGFGPEMILVSAGYDPHWRDPLALEDVTVAGFGAMARRLRDWAGEFCGGRLVMVLEGGYDLESLSLSALATISVMAGVEPADPIGPPPAGRALTDVGPSIALARNAHPWWFARV